MALLNEINVKGVPHPIVTDDGYYQEMTVGDAEQLVATTFTEDDAPYNFRTAGGAIDIGDRKQVEGIVGGTVAFNQLVQNGNFSDTSVWTINNGSMQVSDNVGTITATSSGGEFVYQAINVPEGHKVFVTATIKGDVTHNSSLSFGTTTFKAYTVNASWDTVSAVTQKTSSQNLNIIRISDSVSAGEKFYAKNAMCIDLTLMFGSTIADYIYSLEQANAGAGVAWFKKFFPKPYYAYNAGQLMSVKALRHITRGFNAWDEEWELGSLNFNTGEKTNASTNIRSKNYIKALPNTTYFVKMTTGTVYLFEYDADKNFIKYNQTYTVTTTSSTAYFLFVVASTYGTTYKNDICINLHWDGERDGEYEEYVEHVYELDSDLELRGILKLSAGNDLYYDGDVYEPDGTVTRKYGIVNLGTLNWIKATNNRFYATKPTDALSYSAQVAGDLIADGFVTTNKAHVENIDHGISISEGMVYVSEYTITDATAYKAAVSGKMLVYRVVEPTTETADSYNGTQIVDDFGTEEFVDAGVAAGTRDVAIPVGHNSLYQPNLRAKLEMVPEAPEDEGYYVVYHHDGINEYVPLIIPQELPNLPSEDGTYVLKCTVASGSATLSFESEV